MDKGDQYYTQKLQVADLQPGLRAHFSRGRKQTPNDIPSVFPRFDQKSGEIVWPVDISHLLEIQSLAAGETEETEENKVRSVELNFSVEHTTTTTTTHEKQTETAEPTSNVLQNDDPIDGSEKDWNCQEQINMLLNRVSAFEKQLEVEKFGVKRFQCSDSDIRFYTGLTGYDVFLSLYNFVKPRAGFQLNYNNKIDYKSKPRDSSYVVTRGRPRKLCDIDELFLTLSRLRLGLLERDLAARFNISTTEVSEIFSTWVDRMADCLGQITFLTDRETMKVALPGCFRPDYENVYFIIDCTSLIAEFIEKPSQIIQQSATWSEYKSHNTGKALIALSPLLLPVFVFEVYPGSISDEEVVSQCGILKHAHRGDIWLADKGFLIQHILDDYGVRVETPVKLEGKKQFSEEEDIKNRRNSQVRVHVERAIRRVKVFRFLRGNFPIRCVHLLSKVWKVCAWLTAFLPPLIDEKGELGEDREE